MKDTLDRVHIIDKLCRLFENGTRIIKSENY